jgi:hypothetical protein
VPARAQEAVKSGLATQHLVVQRRDPGQECIVFHRVALVAKAGRFEIHQRIGVIRAVQRAGRGHAIVARRAMMGPVPASRLRSCRMDRHAAPAYPLF